MSDSIRNNDGMKLKGFIQVTLKNKNNEVVKTEKHNFVVNNVKKMLLAESMNYWFKMNNANPFGLMYSRDNGVYKAYTNSGAFLNFNNLKSSDCLMMLNFGSDVNLDAQSKHLPIINSDGSGVDFSKVTGYSVGRTQSTDQREGILQPTITPELATSMYQVVNSYMFDTNIANGDFNWLAVAPGFGNTPYRGFGAFKCISSYNLRSSGNQFNQGYVRPDTKDTKGNVLTGPGEILTFETQDGVSRWIYNLTTGEKRAVQPGEFAFDWQCTQITSPQFAQQQLVIGDYLYVLSNTTLYKIDISTGQSVQQVNVAYQSPSAYHSIGMYYEGNEIICSCGYNSPSYNTRSYVTKVNPDTMTTQQTYNDSYGGIGGLPSDWSKIQVSFNKLGEYYLVNYWPNSDTFADNSSYNGCTLVCTDLSNVLGSLVGIAPPEFFVGYEVDGSIYFVNQFTSGETSNVYIRTSDSGGQFNYNYAGIYVSDFNFSNFWSAVKLDQTYTKTDELRAFIDYGYTFE